MSTTFERAFNYDVINDDAEAVREPVISDTLVDILNGSVLIRPPEAREPFFIRHQGAAILSLVSSEPEVTSNVHAIPSKSEHFASYGRISLQAA